VIVNLRPPRPDHTTTSFHFTSHNPPPTTMNATRALQAGRQPMIRFLGKRSLPSRTPTNLPTSTPSISL
jgi:hypothetical protein